MLIDCEEEYLCGRPSLKLRLKWEQIVDLPQTKPDMQIRLWSLLILIASITFSCDQCKDVNCLNSGTCVDGDCECLDG